MLIEQLTGGIGITPAEHGAGQGREERNRLVVQQHTGGEFADAEPQLRPAFRRYHRDEVLHPPGGALDAADRCDNGVEVGCQFLLGRCDGDDGTFRGTQFPEQPLPGFLHPGEAGAGQPDRAGQVGRTLELGQQPRRDPRNRLGAVLQEPLQQFLVFRSQTHFQGRDDLGPVRRLLLPGLFDQFPSCSGIGGAQVSQPREALGEVSLVPVRRFRSGHGPAPQPGVAEPHQPAAPRTQHRGKPGRDVPVALGYLEQRDDEPGGQHQSRFGEKLQRLEQDRVAHGRGTGANRVHRGDERARGLVGFLLRRGRAHRQLSGGNMGAVHAGLPGCVVEKIRFGATHQGNGDELGGFHSGYTVASCR